MKSKGFASIYLVYAFFLVFIVVMLTGFMINNYKKNFLNTLKNDIKEELMSYHLGVQDLENGEKSGEKP